MPLTSKEIVERLVAELEDAVVAHDVECADPWVKIKPETLRSVVEWLRFEPDLRMDLLHCISGVDLLKLPDHEGDELQVVYHFDSIRNAHTTVIKVDLPRSDPTIDSLTDMYGTCHWQERETFDLMGIKFRGHPNLKRILCADDWVGHPLRKDYEWPEEYHGIPCGPFETEFANIPPEHEVWLKEFAAEEEKEEKAKGAGGPAS